MAKRRFQIDHLIINSPFDEPARYWKYIREVKMFEMVEESRRPAGYLISTPNARAHDDPGVFIPLALANDIRPRVKLWREAGYAGITGVTRRLLEHWYDKTERDNRFFFCQLEAIETLIWLHEAPAAERRGIDVPSDGGPFRRLCAKMATGTGKTVVMAMLAAWQILNKVAYPSLSWCSKNLLVIAPGLTVKNRLQVLYPDSEGNYFDEFGIVPGGMIDSLRQGRVKVLNWHKLDWESDTQIAKKRSVDKRGAKSDEAYVRDVLGEMASERDLVVVNDEAHHAWRAAADLSGIDKADIEEAKKWVQGLDRIHRARGIVSAFDFSATPFVPSGKKNSDEALFGWIVSDFGLNDAIESGLVKTPRVVVRDDGKLTKDYKSRFYHLYMDDEVHDDLNRKVDERVPLPDLVINGYYMLGKDWLEAAREWKDAGQKVPPVMITVANRTETAARVKYAIDHGKIRIEELCDPDRTLHIDSKVLNKAEAADDPLTTGADEDEADADDVEEQPIKKLTKQQQAERLRQIVDTVGRIGKPGEQIQSVISVGMLSEGWDAKTVTHIMGLRAFSSQLLCEQVVGRGLRRTSYEIKPGTDRFEPEYVNVFGVPFTFMHTEETDGPPPPPPSPKTRIEALVERRDKYEIKWPNIIRIDYVYREKLDLDVAKVPPLELDASNTATIAEIAPVIDGKADVTRVSDITLQELGAKFRMQKIVFEAARDVYDQMQPGWRGNREGLLGQLIGLVERFVNSNRIEISPPLFEQDDLRRRIIITLNMNKLVQHIFGKIQGQNAEGLTPIFDTQHPIRGTGDMRPWYTGRPCELATHSHVNCCTFDSTWEASEAFRLDRNRHVVSWVKNDHLGFDIVYLFKGVVQKYRPDFLIKLANGLMLVLEVKGQEDQQSQAKRDSLAEWVKAVNEQGGFGTWASDVSHNPADVDGIIERYAKSHSAKEVRIAL
ncbi:MAG: DEAD/DEAH box helicase family protein [Planctomycetota bacterium]|nr:DEAD/DEAH box helicase family protein [Planctomycetota bacterium]